MNESLRVFLLILHAMLLGLGLFLCLWAMMGIYLNIREPYTTWPYDWRKACGLLVAGVLVLVLVTFIFDRELALGQDGDKKTLQTK